MLVNLSKILQSAYKNKYAIGAFNITAIETALAIMQAGEQESSPIILQASEKTINYFGLDLTAAIGHTLAARTTLPVVLHLDHGKNIELAYKAIEIGFSSVMLDVSSMTLNERIPTVKKFVEFAHRHKVSVEAEEDVIGGKEDFINGKHPHFTDPKRAYIFCKETGIDCFAVSIGNRHGKAEQHEQFDLELLSQINKAVDIPLVLHGASATPPNLIKKAIELGVSKINIDTELRIAFSESLGEVYQELESIDPRDQLSETIDAVREIVVKDMRLFGSSNKG
ncbi:class II fructose-bisphosphate aldolase [Candidatus Berkelbacteria bacterium]|nr:class II fructose-bisphosphate aldolase [Candidatus Berkelbacteria bacterium]